MKAYRSFVAMLVAMLLAGCGKVEQSTPPPELPRSAPAGAVSVATAPPTKPGTRLAEAVDDEAGSDKVVTHEVTYSITGTLDPLYTQDTPHSEAVQVHPDITVKCAYPSGSPHISDELSEPLTVVPWTKTVKLGAGSWASLSVTGFKGNLELEIAVDGQLRTRAAGVDDPNGIECQKLQIEDGPASLTARSNDMNGARPANFPTPLPTTQRPEHISGRDFRPKPTTNPQDAELLKQFGYATPQP